MKKDRLTHIDIGAGIMIVWVVLFHALGMGREIEQGHSVENMCIIFPYLHFFMPWFFYKSGVFFKKCNNRKLLWKKDIYKFLKPFIIWSIVGYGLFLLFAWHGNYLTLHKATYSVLYNFVLNGSIPINEVLWFLLSLCLVRWIANELIPFKDDKRFIIKCIFIVVACYLITILLHLLNHHLQPRYIANVFSGLAFYSIGFCLRDIENNKWVILISFIIFVCGCFCGFTIVDMWPNKLLTGHYMLWIPTSVCGIIVFNSLCRYLTYLELLKNGFSTIGRFAMPIYVTHAIIIIIISEVIVYLQDSTLQQNASYIILGSCIVCLTLICMIWKRIASKHIL